MLDKYKTPMRDVLTTMKVYDAKKVKERQHKERNEKNPDYVPIAEGSIMFNPQGERVYPRIL